MMERMRADEIISKSTVTTGRAIVALSSSIVFVKVFDLQLNSIGLLQNIKMTGAAMDWAAFGLLVYFAYAHLTNWTVDRLVAPELVKELCYFGDHPDSWDCDNPPLRGRITNAWIVVQGGFGYSIWTPRVSLVYGLHMLVPALLWIAAASVLAVA